MKGWRVLFSSFSASNEMILEFFSFNLFIVDYVENFPYIEPSIHFWDEACVLIMDDRFDVFMNSVYKNFIEYICIIFINEIVLKFSFVVSLYGLDKSVIVVSKNKFRSVPSLSILCNSLKSISIRSSWKV